jgi:hypothetical protein
MESGKMCLELEIKRESRIYGYGYMGTAHIWVPLRASDIQQAGPKTLQQA